MIRIKLFYTRQDYLKALSERDIPICEYNNKSFYYLVQGCPGEEKSGPPFRDADSVRFIREIDHARFVEDDWYSVVTPLGRTDMTALCGGTQYALTVIANSRRGIYTSFKGYEDDIWSRLASLSVDVLIYFCLNIYSEDHRYLPFKPETRKKVVVENYRYNGEEIEVRLTDRSISADDEELHVDGFFDEFRLDWRNNLGIFIKGAEALLERSRLYKHPPTVTSVKEFAETLGERYARMFYEYLDEIPIWEDDVDFYAREKAFLEGLSIHNYMLHVPTESISKYPSCFIIKKRKGSLDCTISREVGYKYPTFSSMLMEKFVRLSDNEREEFEKLVVVFDTELFDDAEKVFETAIWAFKSHDHIMELYDGLHIVKEFVDFVKSSYEAGLLTVAEEEDDE